jgi:diamine N-acetyltransferase
MTFLLRQALDRDAEALARFAAEVFAEAFGAQNNPDDLAAYLAEAFGPEVQAAEIADPSYRTLLLEVGGELAGYAQLRRRPAPPCVTTPAPVELKRFYLAAGHRGEGLAARLMEAAAGAAVSLGGRSIWLGVWEENPRARAFYRKCGFEDVGSQIFVVGTDPQRDRVLVRRLD